MNTREPMASSGSAGATDDEKNNAKKSAVGVAFMGLGTFMTAHAKYEQGMARAEAEHQNAAWYREEAAHAQAAGNRQHSIYEHESKILFGEQMSGFAKAGLDSANSSFFMASQMLQRSQGLSAIDLQTSSDVRLASLRADEASKVAGEEEQAAELAPYVTIGTTIAMLL